MMKKGAKNPMIEKGKDEEKKTTKKILFTTDGYNVALNGFCMYFLRTSTKRTLGEETFQVGFKQNFYQRSYSIFVMSIR